MIRGMIVVALASAGCARGMWVAEADAVKIEQDLCEVSRSFDLVGHATLVEIGGAKDMLFALWPQSYVRVTEVVIDVDESVRGGTGKMRVLISAPARDGKLRTSSRATPVGNGGWVLGAKLEHADGSGASMFLDSEGFAPSDKDQIKFDWYGSYDKAGFRSQFERLPSDCGRGVSPKR